MTNEHGGASTAEHIRSEDLTWAPGWQLREWIGDGRCSAVQVTEHFLNRIAALEPRLRALRTLDAEGAIAQARAIDKARQKGAPLGPLAGVPITVKDHIAIKGLHYHPLFSEQEVPAANRDSIVVERLRAAGAVILGTTVSPGMGNFGVQGQHDLSWHPRNPWDLDRVPGASTAGGAASVAAGLTPITIGSDAAGSCRLPAAFCGILGFNSSFGRVPQVDYQFPVRTDEVTLGPLARDVRDMAIVMSVIAGPDGRDISAIADDVPDYLTSLEEGMAGARLAWTDDFGFGKIYSTPQSARVIAGVRRSAGRFSTLGAILETTAEKWEDYFPAFRATVATYAHPFKVAAYQASLSPDAFAAGVEVQRRNWDKFRALFQDHDLLLSPTVQFTAPKVEEWDRSWQQGGDFPHGTFMPTYAAHTHIFSILGWPALSVPCGFVDGLPVGLQIIGQPGREPLILRAAAAFMKGFDGREFRPGL